MRKCISALALILIMAAVLVGCAKTQPDTQTQAETQTVTQAQPETQAQSGAQEDDRTLFFESEQIRIFVEPVQEDSLNRYIPFYAENLTEEEINLTISAIAVNGYTMESGFSAKLPAKGTAWMPASVTVEEIRLAGVSETVSELMALFSLYDAEYNSTGDILAGISVSDGAAEALPEVGGQIIYDADGYTIRCLGVTESSEQVKQLKICIENNSDSAVYMTTEGGATAGETVYPSFYRNVLPGTRSIGTMSVYTADYGQLIDPETIPYLCAVFRICDMDYSKVDFMTDPLKITLGEEGRFKISDDGKSMEVGVNFFIYADGEWIAESSDENILSVESANAYDADDGLTQLYSVNCAAGAEGEASIHILYHPIGESIVETADYYPIFYLDRTMNFVVDKDGKIGPGEATISARDYSGDASTVYQYRLDKDGNLIHKFSIED